MNQSDYKNPALPGKYVFHERTDCNVEMKGNLEKGQKKDSIELIIVKAGKTDHHQTIYTRIGEKAAYNQQFLKKI